jgi:hypothetical protein
VSLIAKVILIKCEEDHKKHTIEKFSYVKRDALRSCATCVDMVEGLSDWEIELLKDIPDFHISPRLLMASHIRNSAMASSK